MLCIQCTMRIYQLLMEIFSEFSSAVYARFFFYAKLMLKNSIPLTILTLYGIIIKTENYHLYSLNK